VKTLRENLTQLLTSAGMGGPLRIWLSRRSSYLRAQGWYRSQRTRQAVNAAGEPIPYFPYGLTRLLQGRLSANLRVFEYGAGNSTAWFAQRVQSIVSVEHSPLWAEKMGETVSDNALVIQRDIGDSYIEEIRSHGLFDIVVVDGRRRVDCAQMAVDYLTPGGVIIWDDTDRPRYSPGIDRLRQLGFHVLPFTGMGPIDPFGKHTSLFYRSGNCLGV
jgi:hypothetical protein